MSGFSTTDDYQRAAAAVQAVLDVWDPYCLRRGGAPPDEWEDLARAIVRHIPRMATAGDCVRAVAAECQAAFGPDDFSEESCAQVGHAIFAVLLIGHWVPARVAPTLSQPAD